MSSDVPTSIPCGRCRSRRVKCDRRRPGCERCEKVSRPCPGYNSPRRFQDEGPRLRRKFAKDGHRYESTVRLEEISLYSSPQGLPFSHALLDNAQPRLSESLPHQVDQGNAPLEVDGSTFEDEFFDIDPSEYYAKEGNYCGFVPYALPSVGSEDYGVSTSVASTTAMDSAQLGTPASIDTSVPETSEALLKLSQAREREEAFLIRRYIDVVSPHLDMFDKDRYFGHSVPIHATRSLLLKDSIAAISAKQLGRQNTQNINVAQMGGGVALLDPSGHAAAENIDWAYQAAGFYEKAIRNMIEALRITGEQATRNRTEPHGYRSILPAVSMFLLYESMDNQQMSIIHHLSGALHLMQDALNEQKYRDPTFDISFTKSWRASFWNFACYDYLTSFASQMTTRIDFLDAALWEAAGLPLIDNAPGLLLGESDNNSPRTVSEIASCRTLIWILLKALTFAARASSVVESGISPARPGNQNWNEIEAHLEMWHKCRPESFKICSRVTNSFFQPTNVDTRTSGRNSPSTLRIPVPELIFTNDMGATALILYHFTQLLVLLNKPLIEKEFSSYTGSGRLRAYREFKQRTDYHATEICGIALGQPRYAVQVHSIQPLFLAGSCLEENDKKIIIGDLLVGIQERTGHLTEWRRLQLNEEWSL